MFTKDTLAKEKIIVTGGGSGLGLAMAQGFVDLGAKVGLCGRSHEKLVAAQQSFGDRCDQVAIASVDVRDEQAVDKGLADLERAMGGVTGLVNNAAGNFYAASEDLSKNGFQTVVDIVLTGSFLCSRWFGRYVIERKSRGAILNIVTTYTQHGSAYVLPSACAKAGVAAMTKSLAYEWAPHGIRVNGIAPGPIPTKGAWARLMPDPDLEEQYRKRLPLQRFGRPEELSALASFLLSPLAEFINGEIVNLDGAESLRGGQFNFLSEMYSPDDLRHFFSTLKAARGKEGA